MRDVEIELKVLVVYLFYHLIAWLPCTGNGNIKNLLEVDGFLNRVTFTKGVKCILVFTEKCFRVARDDLNHLLMEDLGSKTLRIHLESTKGVYV